VNISSLGVWCVFHSPAILNFFSHHCDLRQVFDECFDLGGPAILVFHSLL